MLGRKRCRYTEIGNRPFIVPLLKLRAIYWRNSHPVSHNLATKMIGSTDDHRRLNKKLFTLKCFVNVKYFASLLEETRSAGLKAPKSRVLL